MPCASMCTWHVHQCALACTSMCTCHVHQCTHAMYINVGMPCASMCTWHVHQCAHGMYINVHMACTSMCTHAMPAEYAHISTETKLYTYCVSGGFRIHASTNPRAQLVYYIHGILGLVHYTERQPCSAVVGGSTTSATSNAQLADSAETT